MPLSHSVQAYEPAALGSQLPERRLRILIVCPEPPAPPTWGFALRVYHLGRELGRHHDVTLLTYDTQDPTRDWDELASRFSVHGVKGRRGSRRAMQARSLVSRRSFHLRRFQTAEMQRAILDVGARGAFDIIQVESSQMFGFEFPDRAAVVIDEHNIEHDLVRRVAQLERSKARRAYLQLECRKVHREEVAAWRRADGCVLTSDNDEQKLHDEVPSARTRVVPNGVDLEYFSPAESAVDTDSIVFVGAINYRPNSDAVVYLAERILPLVRRSRPRATLTVVGPGAPAEVRRLAGNGAVRIVGRVPDVRPYMAAASVLTAPLRMGGGTRLKVLEGLAMAKAVVSTRVGCEGLDVRPDLDLLVADDEETFAGCVVRLMDDPHLRQQLGRAGRRRVEERYSWAAVTGELEDFYRHLVQSRRGVAA